jgi:hypothetical protein
MLGLVLPLVFAWAVPDEWDGFRSRIACAGDANGDGVLDLLVSSSVKGDGPVWVLSGRDGARLHTVDAGSGGVRFGSCLAGVGDVDGDGRDDFAAGATATGNAGAPRGSGFVTVYSGRNGSPLHTLEPAEHDDRFGACVAGGGDLDGDGTRDIAVAGRRGVSTYSGRDGERIAEIAGDFAETPVGIHPGGAGRGAQLLVGREPVWASLYEGPDLRAEIALTASDRLCDGRPTWTLATGAAAILVGSASISSEPGSEASWTSLPSLYTLCRSRNGCGPPSSQRRTWSG